MNRNSFYIGATLRLPITTPLSPISCMPCTIPPSLSLPAIVVASGILVVIIYPPTAQKKNKLLQLLCKLNLTDAKPKKSRASVRYSTYSMSPSLHTTDSAIAEISDIEKGLTRMENKALTSQRVFLTDDQNDRMKKLALGAKLERALDRRMSSQDAVMRKRTTSTVSQKSMNEKEAAA